MNLLKVSALRGKIVKVKAKSFGADLVHLCQGGVQPRSNGYVRFFEEDKMLDGMRWMNHQRKKWGKKLLTKKEIENG